MSMDATTTPAEPEHAPRPADDARADEDAAEIVADDAPGDALDPEALDAAVEAILIAADRATPAPRIAEAVGLSAPPGPAIAAAVERLNEHYDRTARAFRIERVAGGYRIMTRPQHARVVGALKGARNAGRLSKAAVETLAIIAYKQPITRARLEEIRGVACGEVLRSLLERRLITITGRAEELGRPMLYGTTKQFLEAFGLASVRDLPTVAELGVAPHADGDDAAGDGEA